MEKEKRQKRDHDFAVNAFRVVQEATGQTKPKQPKTLSTGGSDGRYSMHLLPQE
jgi:hypothetical protein